MSYLWHFKSFSWTKLDGIVGGGDSSHEQLVVEAVTWDDWGDMEVVERLARVLVRSGPSYDRLSSEEASVMDGLISMLFCPEGLEEELEIEYESPDGLHPSVVKELLDRAGDSVEIQYLPILNGGRRLGLTELTHCEYCLLCATEVSALRQEVEQVIALPGSWSESYVPDLIDECLVSVLKIVEAKQAGLMGSLG